MNYLDSLGDGWTIYLWLVVGALIIAASIYGIRWASRNEQFDEDIKYLVFTESDKNKMAPEEYAKSRQVLSDQRASRERVLKQQEEERNRGSMKRGEKVVLALMAVMVVSVMLRNVWVNSHDTEKDRGIPFYTTASPELTRQASELYRQQQCRECHSLWSVRNIMESVPAPALDGIGSLRDEAWFYQYFSAPNPQAILPSRLKPQYRMPSYATLTDDERHTLARYMASLKVEDWYLADTRKAEYEKLTGKDYHP